MMLASELPADMKPAVGDRCFCLRGNSPQLVTITALIEGGNYLYVRHGPRVGDEFVVLPAELSYASYSDCEQWIAARQGSAKPADQPPTPETVQRAYTPPPAAQLSLFG